MEKQKYLSPHIKVAEIQPSSFMEDWVSIRTGKAQNTTNEITINAKESQTSDFSQDDSGWDDN